MDTVQKRVTYIASNTYDTLNSLSGKTRNVWMVFHGIGYLSRYFLPYFDALDREENYVVAPQAPSKYYLDKDYRHVGASWLTREDTAQETENILNYISAVYRDVQIPAYCRLIVLGYSQGVSVAARWVARCKIACDQLVFYAGGIPDELVAEDFQFLSDTTKITFLVGDADEFLSPGRMERESSKIESLFRGKAEIHVHEGGHEIQKTLINKLI